MREAGTHNQHIGRSRSDDIALLPKRILEAIRKRLKKDVGLLAAGWNLAAQKLKVGLPAWVKRHGKVHGEFSEQSHGRRFILAVTNAVPFVGNVRGYAKRIQKVIDYQARKLERQVEHLLKTAVKKAGF
jgi:hypothetical protein